MCYPHVNRNIDKQLKELKRESKSEDLHKKVDANICHFQWSTTENKHFSSFKCLVDKYVLDQNTSNFNETEKLALVYLTKSRHRRKEQSDKEVIHF